MLRISFFAAILAIVVSFHFNANAGLCGSLDTSTPISVDVQVDAFKKWFPLSFIVTGNHARFRDDAPKDDFLRGTVDLFAVAEGYNMIRAVDRTAVHFDMYDLLTLIRVANGNRRDTQESFDLGRREAIRELLPILLARKINPSDWLDLAFAVAHIDESLSRYLLEKAEDESPKPNAKFQTRVFELEWRFEGSSLHAFIDNLLMRVDSDEARGNVLLEQLVINGSAETKAAVYKALRLKMESYLEANPFELAQNMTKLPFPERIERSYATKGRLDDGGPRFKIDDQLLGLFIRPQLVSDATGEEKELNAQMLTKLFRAHPEWLEQQAVVTWINHPSFSEFLGKITFIDVPIVGDAQPPMGYAEALRRRLALEATADYLREHFAPSSPRWFNRFAPVNFWIWKVESNRDLAPYDILLKILKLPARNSVSKAIIVQKVREVIPEVVLEQPSRQQWLGIVHQISILDPGLSRELFVRFVDRAPGELAHGDLALAFVTDWVTGPHDQLYFQRLLDKWAQSGFDQLDIADAAQLSWLPEARNQALLFLGKNLVDLEGHINKRALLYFLTTPRKASDKRDYNSAKAEPNLYAFFDEHPKLEDDPAVNELANEHPEFRVFMARVMIRSHH